MVRRAVRRRRASKAEARSFDRIEEILYKGGFPEDDRAWSTYYEQYKLIVQTSESLVARRQGTNTFFLTVNGALLTAIGFFVRPGSNVHSHGMVIIILCLTGIIISWAWRTLLISFGQLNSGKFKVILRMEKYLPAAIFDAEWEALDRGENPKVYRSFTNSESRVPVIFIAIYALAVMIGLVVIIFGRVPFVS